MPASQLEPTYRDALTASWKLIMHHKLLWVLGAMAMLIGQFGLGNFLGTFWTFITEGSVALNPWIPDQISWPTTSFVVSGEIAGLLVMMLALFIGIVVMATCAQGAVIVASLRYFNRKKISTLGSIWHVGARHFWRLLVVNGVQQIILLFTLSAMLGFWRDFSHTRFDGIAMLVIGLTLGLFIGLLTSVLSIYTAFFVVDKEDTLSEAVGKAYELFKEHILVSLEVSGVMLLLTLIPALIIGVASYVVIVAALPFWFVGISSQSTLTAEVGTMTARVLLAVITALIGGAFNAFTIASWAYCYRNMDKKLVPSRLVHHIQKTGIFGSKKRSRVVKGRV